jgi:hypothetical protein
VGTRPISLLLLDAEDAICHHCLSSIDQHNLWDDHLHHSLLFVNRLVGPSPSHRPRHREHKMSLLVGTLRGRRSDERGRRKKADWTSSILSRAKQSLCSSAGRVNEGWEKAESYSGRVVGTCGATTAKISLRRALFILRSDSVVVDSEGEAFTSINHGRNFESMRTS